jgi:hypothetical protein
MDCCMGLLMPARLGDGTEVAGDRSILGAGLLMGPGLELGMLVAALLCTDAGLRTCSGLIGDVRLPE